MAICLETVVEPAVDCDPVNTLTAFHLLMWGFHIQHNLETKMAMRFIPHCIPEFGGDFEFFFNLAS